MQDKNWSKLVGLKTKKMKSALFMLQGEKWQFSQPALAYKQEWQSPKVPSKKKAF